MKNMRLFICGASMTAVFGSFAVLPAPLILPAAHAQAVVKMPEAKMAFVPIAGYRLIARKDLPAQAQQALFAYVGPSTGGFASNVNLVMQTATPGIKADVPSAEQLGDILKKSNATYKKVGTGALTIGGEKGAFVMGTFMVQTHAVQAKQVLVVHAGQQYVITFSAATSVFAKQVGAFDKMIASLKWL